MTHNKRADALFRLSALFFIVAARLTWMLEPTLFWCLLFWAASFLWCYPRKVPRHLRPGLLLLNLGMAMNALVTIFNSGRMPVIGVPLSTEMSQLSIWVRAQPSHHLLFLADRWGWWGFSPGDLVLGIGLIVTGFSIYARRRIAQPAGDGLASSSGVPL